MTTDPRKQLTDAIKEASANRYEWDLRLKELEKAEHVVNGIGGLDLPDETKAASITAIVKEVLTKDAA